MIVRNKAVSEAIAVAVFLIFAAVVVEIEVAASALGGRPIGETGLRINCRLNASTPASVGQAGLPAPGAEHVVIAPTHRPRNADIVAGIRRHHGRGLIAAAIIGRSWTITDSELVAKTTIPSAVATVVGIFGTRVLADHELTLGFAVPRAAAAIVGEIAARGSALGGAVHIPAFPLPIVGELGIVVSALGIAACSFIAVPATFIAGGRILAKSELAFEPAIPWAAGTIVGVVRIAAGADDKLAL